MTSKRLLKMQADVLARYRRIRDLWALYYAKSTLRPEVFGSEFYRAVGELLQGKRLDRLELVHLKLEDLESTSPLGRLDGTQNRKTYHKPSITRRHGSGRRISSVLALFGDG